MFHVLGWMIYGLVVGLIAKLIFPNKDNPTGFLATIGIGCAGSFVGGFISWVLGWGQVGYEPSGMIMGIVGGVIFCFAYAKYKDYLNTNG
jgi:uncharacterized membrane protein YeaQ/YmgE (transglycosylase-associated protein family)